MSIFNLLLGGGAPSWRAQNLWRIKHKTHPVEHRQLPALRKRTHMPGVATPTRHVAHYKLHPVQGLLSRVEELEASIRSKVEHPVRVTKRHSGTFRCSVQWAAEEHAAAAQTVPAVRPVDGVPPSDGVKRISAPLRGAAQGPDRLADVNERAAAVIAAGASTDESMTAIGLKC